MLPTKYLWPDHQYYIDNKLGQLWAKRILENHLNGIKNIFILIL